jgi:hypothetical protein
VSDFFHESLLKLTRGDESTGTQLHKEMALAYAISRIATEAGLKLEDRVALAGEAKAEAILFGADNERVEEIYKTTFLGLAARIGEARQEASEQLKNEEE